MEGGSSGKRGRWGTAGNRTQVVKNGAQVAARQHGGVKYDWMAGASTCSNGSKSGAHTDLRTPISKLPLLPRTFWHFAFLQPSRLAVVSNLYATMSDVPQDRSGLPSVPVCHPRCSSENELPYRQLHHKKPKVALSLATYSNVYTSSRRGRAL